MYTSMATRGTNVGPLGGITTPLGKIMAGPVPKRGVYVGSGVILSFIYIHFLQGGVYVYYNCILHIPLIQFKIQEK